MKETSPSYLKSLVLFFYVSGFSLIVFSLDRLTKLWAEITLTDRDIPLIGNFFRFRLSFNENLALSIPFPIWGQILLSLLLLGGLTYYFVIVSPVRRWDILASSLIYGGALGNLVDRAVFRRVTDFIDCFGFPIFNLADTFIFLGVAYFLVKEFLSSRKKNAVPVIGKKKRERAKN